MTPWDRARGTHGKPGRVIPKADGNAQPALDPEEANSEMQGSPCQHLLKKKSLGGQDDSLRVMQLQVMRFIF